MVKSELFDNVIVISYKANKIKGAASLADLLAIAEFYNNRLHKKLSGAYR